jgi:hypothetical protein
MQLVEFVVSGERFATQYDTIAKFPNSLFYLMLKNAHSISAGKVENAWFIDRPRKPFETILVFMQTGKWYISNDPVEQKMLIDEADFYGIEIAKTEQWKLDRCSEHIQISNDAQCATKLMKKGFGFVLGSVSFNEGIYAWEVKFIRLKHWMVIGILHSKPLNSFSYGSDGSFGISNTGQMFCKGKLQNESHSCSFQQGDIVRIKVDLVCSTVIFKNPATSSIVSIENLDKLKDYYPHFCLADEGDEISIKSIQPQEY